MTTSAEKLSAWRAEARKSIPSELWEFCPQEFFTLLDELAAAHKALQPFATFAKLPGFDGLPDNRTMAQVNRPLGGPSAQVTVGDFKRALAVLEPKP